MTDQSLNGTADEGHGHSHPPRFSTAEDVNPPQPGEPGYDEYAQRRGEWLNDITRDAAGIPEVEVRTTPYFHAGLGRTVTADDPAPKSQRARPGDGGTGNPPASRIVAAAPDDDIRRRTDASNGEYFARLYGDQVRYDHRRKRWLRWGGH